MQIDAALSGRTRSRLRHRRGAHQTSSEPPHQAVHRVKTAATGQRQAVRRSSRQRARRSTPQSSRAVTPDVNTPWSPDQASDDASLASPSCSPVVDPAGQEGLPPWSLGEGEGQHAAEQPAVEADGALSVGLGDVSPRLLGWPPPVQQADAMDVQELTGWAHEAPVESSSCHPVLPIPDGVDQTPGDALPVFDPPGGTPYLDLDFLGDLSHNRPCEEFETRDLLGSDMPPVDTGRQKTATPRPAPNMAWWALAREFLELLEQILSSRSTSHSPGTGVASGVS